MKKFKNLISFIMTITLVLNLSIFVSAEGTEKKVSLVPLDYLDNETSIVIATPINLGWIVSVSAKDINSAWDNDDEFGVVNFKNAIMEYNESNELEFIFNNSDYKNGSLAVLLFENKTKDECC